MSTMTAREDLTYEEQTGWDLAIASMRARHINAYSADDGGIIEPKPTVITHLCHDRNHVTRAYVVQHTQEG